MVTDRLGRAIPRRAMSTYDDGQLVELARAGTRAAFDELFRRHGRRVHDFAYHMLSDADGADDVVQEVFLRVHGGLRKFRGQCPVGNWIMRIAVNECISQRRRSRRRKAEGPLSDAVEASALVHAQPDDGIDIRQALARLRPAERALIVMGGVVGMSYAEIGEITGCSASVVGVKLHRARMKLRHELGDTMTGSADHD